MRTVPFLAGHLSELDLGIEERLEYGRFDLFSALDEQQGPAWSIIDRGRVLGCFGMFIVNRDGVWWAVLSDEARANPFGLYRVAKACVTTAEGTPGIDRILTAVREGFEPGRRWARHFGFIRDGDFNVGNERYERYVKCPHPLQ